ncbi:hypothetical protein CCR80_09805 [Rhodothalassium salexigens]|uniref:hypothetical protein n=1 Tax=Rhodothalassium salexigens TaxID=1086 RepID=UPI0019127D84|nr:hypothetical protein [Rhodothalassium salexigens]MBK5921322.1 hypothetical protein [Rhodothalassium salexigens]
MTERATDRGGEERQALLRTLKRHDDPAVLVSLAFVLRQAGSSAEAIEAAFSAVHRDAAAEGLTARQIAMLEDVLDQITGFCAGGKRLFDDP